MSDTAAVGELGRFEIVAPLGEGGMGAVYRAFDPKLKREVALKVVGDGAPPEPGSTLNLLEISPELIRRTRVLSHRLESDTFGDLALLDEARTMAKLSHPNIVTVYDVGSDGERLFIAMELVEGKNMREWLTGKPSREAVLSVFRQVAHGLAAAHDVGVVHRDLKPDNILIGDDGNAQIADFGLALSPEAGDLLHGGTPAYMAPEVRTGQAATIASDIYSLCVTVAEALGADPKAASVEPQQTLAAIGSIKPRLRRALEDGLAADPTRRPQASELAAALAPTRSKAVFAVAATAVVGVAAVGFALYATRTESSSCADWPQLEATWNDQVAASIESNIRAVGTPLASQTAPRVVSNMNRRRDLFLAQREAGCRAHERGELTDNAFQGQKRCLDLELASLQATRGALENFAETEVRQLVAVSIGSDGYERCTDAARAAQPVPTEATKEIRAEIETAKAEVKKTNDWGAQRDRLQAALDRAESLGDDGLTAEVLYYLARAEAKKKNHPKAIKLFRRSAQLSDPIDKRQFALSTIRLARLEGSKRDSAKSGEAILSFADNVVAERPTDYRLQAIYNLTKAYLASRQRRHDEELSALEAEIKALEHVADQSSKLRLAMARGRAAMVRGEADETIERYQDIVELRREVYGAQHPRVAVALALLGDAAFKFHRFDEGWQWYDESIKLHNDAGMEAAATKWRINRLTRASKTRAKKALVEARDLLQASETLSPYQRTVVSHHLAVALFRLGKLDEAEKAFDETEKLAARIPEGAGKVDSSQQRTFLALVQRDLETADELTKQKLASLRNGDPPYRILRNALDERAAVLLELGRADRAEALLAEALKVCMEARTSDKRACANVALRLARAKTENGDPKATLELMDDHESVFEKASAPANEAAFVRARAEFILGDKSALEKAIAARERIRNVSILSLHTTHHMDKWIASVKPD